MQRPIHTNKGQLEEIKNRGCHKIGGLSKGEAGAKALSGKADRDERGGSAALPYSNRTCLKCANEYMGMFEQIVALVTAGKWAKRCSSTVLWFTVAFAAAVV